jgi:hypothetical protein
VRQRAAAAVRSVLGAAGNVAHEALLIGADIVELAPLPVLAPAARTLLGIRDVLQDVDVRAPGMHARALTRAADEPARVPAPRRALRGHHLRRARRDRGRGRHSRRRARRADRGPRRVRAVARVHVPHETQGADTAHARRSFRGVHAFLRTQARRSFLKRYLRREQIDGHAVVRRGAPSARNGFTGPGSTVSVLRGLFAGGRSPDAGLHADRGHARRRATPDMQPPSSLLSVLAGADADANAPPPTPGADQWAADQAALEADDDAAPRGRARGSARPRRCCSCGVCECGLVHDHDAPVARPWPVLGSG